MLGQIFKLMIGYICGYLFIRWFPVSSQGDLSEMMVIFVLKPLSFLAAMVTFIIGFIANAEVIRNGIELTTLIIKQQRRVNIPQLIICYFILVFFFILFHIAFWQTLSLFCFSIIYGVMSLDYKKLKAAEGKAAG